MFKSQMGARVSAVRSLLALAGGLLASASASAAEPIHVGFLWHMHQPIYYPYETPIQTDAASRFSFSVVDVHNQRFGPYTSWPKNAIQAGLSLPHLGAQVSFTGSLVENLNALAAGNVNGGMWTNWRSSYNTARGYLTALGNRRFDLVAFGYHHPLMPLLDEQDIRMQIRLHKYVYAQNWSNGGDYSRGIFPAETAFSTRMIPALVAEGLEWAIVDNIHFDRACQGYPYTASSNLYPPNPADQVNPDPATTGGAWVQLNNLWAPSRVSAPFGYQPHYAQHIDPATGQITRMIVVPAARYEGNEDGRGGYGAFLYDQVMDQYIQYNTDPAHPMFVLLHHDGDNFGGGSDSYYNSNFQNMVSWVSGDPDYDVTTINDYLDRFPPAASDVIHVEPGSWAGADNGDPEFKKWLGDPGTNGWSPDRNSWAVLTAAKNRVFTAEAIAPAVNMAGVLSGTGSATERAWHWLLVSEASDYWYWDGTEIWDSNVTRGCNQAVIYANQVIATGSDTTPPTVFLPQREPYNPGGIEWGTTPQPSDFEVWTYAYDVSGLQSVTLKWRLDNDGANPLDSIQNETYAGGAEVGPWQSVSMTSSDVVPPTGILVPTVRALRYGAMITGQQDALIDYYVEAIDGNGQITRSDIQHVYVGLASSSGGGDAVTIDPSPAIAGDPVMITYDAAGRVLASAGQVFAHVGYNGWATVMSPDPAMTWDAGNGVWTLTVTPPTNATQLDLVFNDGAGTWDNNGGADWHFPVSGAAGPAFTIDGVLDSGAIELAASANGQQHLWAKLSGNTLYVATEAAGDGNDRFLYVASSLAAPRAANWAKAGTVAGWDAFLADENDNGYHAWFDAAGATDSATGAVLEGTLDLAGEYGALPTQVYLAVGVYASPDGGALRPLLQVPATANGDGAIDASEFLPVTLSAISDCPADLTGDGVVDLGDLGVLFGCWATPCGDLTGDGTTDLADLGAIFGGWGCGQ